METNHGEGGPGKRLADEGARRLRKHIHQQIISGRAAFSRRPYVFSKDEVVAHAADDNFAARVRWDAWLAHAPRTHQLEMTGGEAGVSATRMPKLTSGCEFWWRAATFQLLAQPEGNGANGT
jgi:hypothetical protein